MSEEQKTQRLMDLMKRYWAALKVQGGFLIAAGLCGAVSLFLFSQTTFLLLLLLFTAACIVLFVSPLMILLWTKASFVEFFGPAWKGTGGVVVEKKHYAFISGYVADFALRILTYGLAFVLIVPLTFLILATRLIGLAVVAVLFWREKRKAEKGA